MIEGDDAQVIVINPGRDRHSWAGRVDSALQYLRRNPQLALGLLLLLGLIGFATLGRLFVNVREAVPLSGPAGGSPTYRFPLGTDAQGRNILAVMVEGSYLTIRTGVIASLLGIILGSAAGAAAGYFGGIVDRIVTFVVDVVLTVPSILFLVMISSIVQVQLTTYGMAAIIAALAWRYPARQIRAQIAIMRRAGYVELAKVSGAGSAAIIAREIAPNLLPYLISAFILSLSDAILASVGLEAMGLGPQNEPTLGMTIFWMMRFSAFMLGMWWWILPPVVVLIVLFVSLYLINIGLDEFANPRLRRRS